MHVDYPCRLSESLAGVTDYQASVRPASGTNSSLTLVMCDEMNDEMV